MMKAKAKEVGTVASNEEFVRMRIYDGDLKIDDAADELLRLERAQHAETRRQLREALEILARLQVVR